MPGAVCGTESHPCPVHSEDEREAQKWTPSDRAMVSPKAPGGKSLFGRPLSEEGCWGSGSNAREPENRDEVGGALWMRFKALEEWMDGGWGTPEVNRKWRAPEKRGRLGGGDLALHS